jgi:hypothetical protein
MNDFQVGVLQRIGHQFRGHLVDNGQALTIGPDLSEDVGSAYGNMEWLSRMYVDSCLRQWMSAIEGEVLRKTAQPSAAMYWDVDDLIRPGMAEEVIEARHRLEMVRLATAANPHFSTTDIELSRSGKSYSIDTIRYFRERCRGSLFFILGGDAFAEIETWKEFQNLFSLCNFVVMTRPGSQKTL